MAQPEMSITSTITNKDCPYVTFVSRTEQDVKESKAQGRMVWVERHYAKITPPGTRDEHFELIPQWWGKMEREVDAGRIMAQWLMTWQSNYERWKKGQEVPENGTPIRGWQMLSGAQQNTLCDMNVTTVEALADLTAEGVARIGMGGLELKRRAENWLLERDCVESGAVKMSAIQRENEIMKETIKGLEEKVKELSESVDKKAKRGKEAE